MHNSSPAIKFTKTEKALFFTGILLRLVYFVINLFIGGIHDDEVMLTLNAVSLSDSLTDIFGERLPVYFDTWLFGGQSPAPTYLIALFVKLFGHSLLAVRLPMLLFSILGFCALFGFAKEVFKNSNYALAVMGLGCFSPWLIFSAAYELDCNYMPHLLMIALYFLAVALRTKKLRFYILSMVFFALGFYCYIAAVFIIPVMLLTVYLVLLLKKKIGIKETAVSVITVVIVSLPFILFGLVALGAVPPFKLFGLNFSDMPDYARESSIALASGGIGDILMNTVSNAALSFIMLTVNDISFTALGLNIFQFGNALSGLFFAFGIFAIIAKSRKNRKAFPFAQKLFMLGMAAAILSFCAMNNDPHLGIFYRYGTLTYFMLPIEAVGFTEAAALLKKVDFKKALTVYLCLSFIVFNVQFFGAYMKTIDDFDLLYGDGLYACLEEAEATGNDSIVIYEDNPEHAMKLSVYLRYYYLDDGIRFIDAHDEFYDHIINENSSAHLTDSIQIKDPEKNSTVSDDFCIIQTEQLRTFEIGGDYHTVPHGYFSVVYR